MVFVMVQGARVVGVFESVYHAHCHFSDVTGVKFKDIREYEDKLNGDILFMVNDYCQARLKKAVFY